MAGTMLCEPCELYNILNQCTHVPRMAEMNYLCLIGKRRVTLVAFLVVYMIYQFLLCSLSIENVQYALFICFYSLDAREKQDYYISHIVTAKNAKRVCKTFYHKWLRSYLFYSL